MKPYSEKGVFGHRALHHGGNRELDYFFENAFHDMRFFLDTITSHNAVFYTFFGDLEKSLFYISDNMCEDFGFKSRIVEDLPGKWAERIYGNKWKDVYINNMKNVFSEKRELQDVRYQVRGVDGDIIWVRWYARILWNEDRTKPLFIAGRIAKQSDDFICDPLTKLPFTSVLENRLSIMQKQERSCYILGMSLNHIESINIHYSHEFSDNIIKAVLGKVRDAFIDILSAYRLSSTRYMLLIYSDDEDEVRKIAEKLEAYVRETYESAHVMVDRPCMFAVMHFTPDEDPVGTVKNLELLMTQDYSTSSRFDILEISRRNLETLKSNAAFSLALNDDVHNGMRNFSINIQPIVFSENDRIAGGEVLLRWKHDGVNVSPGVFIPILEREFLMSAVGRFVIEEAFKYCSKIIEKRPEFLLTVNLSKTQLDDDTLFEFIKETFAKYHLDGSHIVFEITESTIDMFPNEMHKLVDTCGQLGIALAIDDFGTGYSSLHSLMEYRFDFLKIDRSLLLDIEKSHQNRSFIESLISACHINDMKIVMEGVENDNQKEISKDIRCNYIQGFLFHRPAPAEEIFNTLDEE